MTKGEVPLSSLRWLTVTPTTTDDEHVILAAFHQGRVVAEHSTALFVTAPKRTTRVIQRAAIGNADFLRHLRVMRVLRVGSV